MIGNYLRKHTANLGNKLELAGDRVLEHEGRVPVCGLVLENAARCALSIANVLILRGQAKTCRGCFC
jgi:hypothetical protein